ncbi:3-deoxy-7-phosphoheptulonate synthase [Thiobacillus denitrificans]|uniref:3-deoxy-7-phosphoheptulonate synthase n=1 Tax=Thiobacillus denitrificans TaxID=36861 RepID=UPI00039D4DEC|nr:3-deoxy-7-phosphoheptulonate synthase [Thiobacillus denitrificans]
MNSLKTLTNNINVSRLDPLPSPIELQSRYSAHEDDLELVYGFRESIKRILRRDDKRLLIIVGPCSIHDPKAGIEYAKRLRAISDQICGNFLIVMRSYFEKPRTSLGWKGLINDPYLNGTFQVDEGLGIARQFMIEVTRIGLPLAAEALDPIVPQYIGDLVSWSAIGARTTESQTHREMASGLSCPVGFKNGTDGDVDIAVGAIESARHPHSFLGIDSAGRSSIVRTVGNEYAHLVLRGSDSGPNYDRHFADDAAAAMSRRGLTPRILIDCSHGNSGKNPSVQPVVARNVINQVRAGNESIVGLMFESFLEPGNQPFGSDPAGLRYGCSITDPCLGWDQTEQLLLELGASL